MIRALAVPIILFSMFVTIPQVEATCTTAKIGNQSFTNCSNGVSGFGVQSGPNSFHQFSDGSTSVTNSFGNTSFSNSLWWLGEISRICVGPAYPSIRIQEFPNGITAWSESTSVSATCKWTVIVTAPPVPPDFPAEEGAIKRRLWAHKRAFTGL